MDASFILYAILVLGSTAVLICRAGLMTPKTDPVIRWQHLCMLAGLVFGLALAIAGNPTAAGACHAAGVFAWLMLSSGEWRNLLPPDTAHPQTDGAD